MLCFVRGDLGVALEGEADVVESLEQAMTRKVVNLEAGREATLIPDGRSFETDVELIVGDFGRPARDLYRLVFPQHHS